LKGVEPSKVGEVEKLIFDTLAKVADEGFSEDAIASSMNTIEFQLREFNTGSFPKGLSLMLGSMSKWLYDNSPTEALKFEKPLAELKSKIAESGPKVFTIMIKELLLKNSHRSTIEMAPSKSLEAEQLKVNPFVIVPWLSLLICHANFELFIVFRRNKTSSLTSRQASVTTNWTKLLARLLS
jgi:Zn-dependent M16 (insulinase) family peptidase